MQKSTITIDVHLDPQKMPEQIIWSAGNSSAEAPQKAKAMFLSLWDGAEKSALRIDLWTKDMMVDEMGDFFYQMLSAMSDTLQRSTKQEALSREMREYAATFIKKFTDNMVAQPTEK